MVSWIREREKNTSYRLNMFRSLLCPSSVASIWFLFFSYHNDARSNTHQNSLFFINSFITGRLWSLGSWQRRLITNTGSSVRITHAGVSFALACWEMFEMKAEIRPLIDTTSSAVVWIQLCQLRCFNDYTRQLHVSTPTGHLQVVFKRT